MMHTCVFVFSFLVVPLHTDTLQSGDESVEEKGEVVSIIVT